MLTAIEAKRLLVSRQDPDSHLYSPVGELRRDGDEYVFTYVHGVDRALPGLPFESEHRSRNLFPIFAERVMHPHRPDRAQALAQLGLPAEASPFEVLAVSGGRRTGDTYELTPLPEVGAVELPFLVHGIRHLKAEEQAHVGTLRPGQRLTIQHEPTNVANERALLVADSGTKLGYVPDPLLDYVEEIIKHPYALEVEQVNPPEAGFHLRLLVVLKGRFDGLDWD